MADHMDAPTRLAHRYLIERDKAEAERARRLGAAAPDLLAALEECVTFLPVGDAKPILAAAARARAAIAKATEG